MTKLSGWLRHCLKRFVKDMYDLRQSTGHKATSFAKLEKAVTISSERDVFVGVVKVKIR